MRVERIGEHTLPIPERKTELAGGYDLQAAEDVVIEPGAVGKVRTGFAWEIDAEPPMVGGSRQPSLIPTVNVGLIRDRSGIATKTDLFVVAGVVDGDYRGEVKVALRNTGAERVQIKQGERIAQMLIIVAYRWDLQEALQGELTRTGRGDNSFGSTGK
jgi:dUTP pyrophosphatase